MDWPIGYGADRVLKATGVSALPTLMVFDRAGQLTWRGHDLRGAEDAIIAALAR